MPSIDHCLNTPSEMTTLTNSLEVFDTYKRAEEDKESDEESFHLPIDDDETETLAESKNDEISSLNENLTKETEEEILNKFEDTENVEEKVNDDKCDKDSQCHVDRTGETITATAESNTAENAPELSNQITAESSEQLENASQSEETSEETSNETPNIDEQDIQKPSEIVEKVDEPDENEVEKEIEGPAISKEESVENEAEKEIEGPDISKEESVENQAEKEIEGPHISKVELVAESSEVKEEPAKTNVDLGVDAIEVQEPSVTNDATLPDDNKESEKEQLEIEVKTPEEDRDGHTEPETTMEVDVPEGDTLETAKEEEEKKEVEQPDKCENSNDSDDLMDVTVIRDAEEDNAESAYNEAHPEECDDCDNSSDKMENDVEDENDKTDVEELNSELHTDEVDIDEQPVKPDISDDTDSDSGNKTKDDLTSEVQIEEQDVNKKLEPEHVDKSDDTNMCALKEDAKRDEDDAKTEFADFGQMETDNTADAVRRSLKRLLQSDSEEDDATIKRHKSGEDHVKTDIEDKPKEIITPHILKSLSSLSQFMKEKKLKKMSIYDLEQFCLQKVCEAIVYKSELGDVHHQLKQQEQLIDNMKKEIVILTKQAKDLEIVNKRLLNDLKQQATSPKPLAPLKITRSVGLQVKFVPTNEVQPARRRIQTIPPKLQKITPSPNKTQKASSPVTPVAPPRQLHFVQIATPPKAQPPAAAAAKPATPILSNALQTRRSDGNTAGGTNAAPTKTVPAKTVAIVNNNNRVVKPTENKSSASVIDLTDEDDKKSLPQIKTIPLRTTPIRQLTATPGGLRLATTSAPSGVTNSTTPQLMYVVQSPNNGMASKALLVNFQPNAVLGPGLNGSSVSMLPKANNPLQLKTVSQQKGVQSNKSILKLAPKHPAALPVPPLIKVPHEKSLKAVPPKPYLTIRKTDTGIILQWRMPYELEMYETIASYQLYAYQETNAVPSTDMWRRVGDVKALALPMACTLTQFADKNKYYFAVRPVDVHKRIGPFSEPEEISL